MEKFLVKENIKDIQKYFVVLSWIIEQLFESQRTKLEINIGYNRNLYQMKTQYRIKYLFILLKKIVETTKGEVLIKFIKKKKNLFEKILTNNVICEDFSKKEFINYFIGRILVDHCESFLFFLKNCELAFESLQDSLLVTLSEEFSTYAKEINAELLEKYGKFALMKNVVFKEKSITKRLKKNKWKVLKTT